MHKSHKFISSVVLLLAVLICVVLMLLFGRAHSGNRTQAPVATPLAVIPAPAP